LIATTSVSASGSTSTATTTWSGLSEHTTYQWYAVANDGDLSATSSTWSFDTINDAPSTPGNPSPANASTSVSTSPVLSVDVYDDNGDAMTVYFYNGTSSELIATTSVSASGSTSTATTTWPGLTGNTTYQWYAVADDGDLSATSSTWSFETINDAPSTPGNPSPYNTEEDISIPVTLNVDVYDSNGDAMTVYFYNGTSSELIATTSVSASGSTSTATTTWPGLSEHTTYQWYVVANDGKASATSSTWSFDTINNAPSTPGNPSPANASTSVSTSPVLSVDVSDSNGDAMTVYFYNGTSSELIATTSVSASGSTSTATTTWSGLSEHTTYQWYVVANDGKASATSSTWSFETINDAPSTPGNPSPYDTEEDVNVPVTLSVDVYDSNGDAMTVYFYNGTSSELIATTSISASGSTSTATTTWPGLIGNTTYQWYAVANDGDLSATSSTWSFTTGNTAPNTPGNPLPANASTSVSTSPVLSADVYDPDGDAMTVYFYNNTGPELIATTSVSASGSTSTATTTWPGLVGGITYQWYVVANDGEASATSSTWSFTTISQGPSEPTDLRTEGKTNPSGIADLTPEFTAIGHDPDPGDTLTEAYIQVGTSTSTINNMWDSGWIDITDFTEGTTSPEISYDGDGLAIDGTTYYWRIKFKDDSAVEGSWSTIDAYFKMAQAVYYAQRSSSTSSDTNWEAETEIGTDADGYGHMSLIPLGSGDVMAIYNDKLDGTYYLKYRVYDAGTTSWGPESNIANDCKDNTSKDNWDEYHWFSAIADSSNNVRLIYIDSVNDDVIYTYYNGSTWSSTSTVYSSGTALTHPNLSYDSQYNTFYAIWLENDAVKYKRRSSGSWDDTATVLDSSLNSPSYLGSAYSDSSSIGVTWREGTSSPYLVSYAIITITEVVGTNIDVSGTVYSDEGNTELTSGPVVRTDGSYDFTGLNIDSADIITVYLDTNGGNKAVTVTKGMSTTTSGIDLYQNRVVLRHEEASAITISEMNNYDSVNAEAGLYIWPGKEFAPGGNVTLSAGGSGDSWDGSLKICLGSTFTAAGSESHSIGGSWIASSTATFTSASSTITFISTAGSKTITTAGNDFYNLTFNGSNGGWTFQDNATSTNNFTISQGTVTSTSGTLAVGGDFNVSAGTFENNSGKVLFNSSSAKTITTGGTGNPFYDIEFNGSGGWTFASTDHDIDNDFIITQGTVTSTASTLSIGGSWLNSSGTFNATSGTVTFDAGSTAKTIDPGSSSFNIVTFDNSNGGWTIAADATSTDDWNITNATAFAVASSITIEVQGSYIISDSLTSITTWNSGSVLYLNSDSAYTVGSKSQEKEIYATLKIGIDTDIRIWDSTSSDYTIDASGSLYSQDHNNENGKLQVWGDYHTTSTDYWNYADDFDGEGSANRQCQVTINSGASITVDNGETLEIKGGGSSSGDITVISASASWNLNNDSGSELLFQEATINYLKVNTGTVTVLNTTLNSETTPASGATLNVDWYLGGHVVNTDATSSNIVNATTTISENSTTPQSTIWKWSGSDWTSASTSQTMLTNASGLIPQPGANGAIRIREYSATSTGDTYYKYNLTIIANAFSNYNYYNNQGANYITSASSSEGTNVDKCISENWQRDDIDANNTEPNLDEPPTTGIWYVGMSSDLEFGVDSFSVNLGDLDLSNTFTATATTITYTTTTVGYLIQAYDSAGNDGELTTSSYSIIRWPHDNSAPSAWGTHCNDNASFCGFGYTTNDNDLMTGGTNTRFGTSVNYSGFTSSTQPVADREIGNWTGEEDTITYKVSVSVDQHVGEYNTTITYVCTPQY